MFVFSGSSNQNLAKKIAQNLGVKFASSQTTKFENGELRVIINELKVDKDAIIVQSFNEPVDTNIIEFCLIADAVSRMGAQEITAVIPWLGYSKQDKVFSPGEPLSAKVIARIIQTANIKEIITFDLHNPAITGFFDIPVANLTAKQMFSGYFREKLSDNPVVVAPDAGAIKSSTSFAGELKVPVVYMDKVRDLVTGEVKVLGISRPVNGSDAIIVDDMIVTGSTLVETAKFLKNENIRSVTVAATHHLYVPGAQEYIEKSGFKEIVVSDTIDPAIKSDKLKVLSIADLVADYLKRKTD